MVERPLSMREVLGSIPGFSNSVFSLFLFTADNYFKAAPATAKTSYKNSKNHIKKTGLNNQQTVYNISSKDTRLGM